MCALLRREPRTLWKMRDYKMRRLHTLLDVTEFLFEIEIERGNLLLVRSLSVVDVDDDSEGQKVGRLPALLQEDGNS